MNYPHGRRLKRVYVDPDGFVKFFKEGMKVRHDTRVLKGVPKDAELLACAFDPTTFGILMLVTSKDFDEVPAGTEIPSVHMEFSIGA